MWSGVNELGSNYTTESQKAAKRASAEFRQKKCVQHVCVCWDTWRRYIHKHLALSLIKHSDARKGLGSAGDGDGSGKGRVGGR